MYREGRTVEVTGRAFVSAPPDVFTVILEVSSTRDSASLAQGDVTGQCSKLIDSLMNLGVPKKAISTERFSVTPDYELIFDDNRREVKLKGFKASSWMMLLISLFVGKKGTENDGDVLLSSPSLTAQLAFARKTIPVHLPVRLRAETAGFLPRVVIPVWHPAAVFA